ncbi:hypothetical protein Adt_29613 [Abeliophyllum distichum]|uniref:Uncharacterized protein n=1 Tax=Abeliophyllum distichum TaxID=126358 RepID=A0ABD1R8W1_9LAMI
MGKAQYHVPSDIGRASANKLPYLGLSFCRSSTPTQGPSLFNKAWHQMGKAQYHASSNMRLGSSTTSLSILGGALLLPSLSHLGIGSSAASLSILGDVLLLPSISHLGIGSFTASSP